MSEGGALVRFHDWRAARGRKALTRRLWRSRCIGLVAVPVSIGLATQAFFLIPPPQPSAAAVRHIRGCRPHRPERSVLLPRPGLSWLRAPRPALLTNHRNPRQPSAPPSVR